ncbi:DUF1822 family protein [Crocosphaera sp.]|uniref:DUF1822 family protein n=1 Tax=Crocosphaera sp. TaxID=2729996 RepID=UPI002605292D|nr:DUF1822 family protein [Crocosphaera sp.]MDJ0580054.1 DUF1822 family protein [Crocosphaera sp.]
MNNSQTNFLQSITIPLTKSDHNIALKLATPQISKSKQQQVYVNVLSALVVKHYLDIFDIETDFDNSYVSQAFYHLTCDVADLKIIDNHLGKQGHLECRPLMKGDSDIYIPLDVWDDRIAYVFVQLDDYYRNGLIIGFLPTIDQEIIPLNKLKPLTDFLEFIYIKSVNLREWLNHQFSDSWLSLEEMIKSSQIEPQMTFQLFPAFRSLPINGLQQQLRKLSDSINLEKPINDIVNIIKTTENEKKFWEAVELLRLLEPSHPAMGISRIKELETYLASPLIMMIHIVEKTEETMAIALQVNSLSLDNKLPPNLTLSLFEGTDKLLKEIVTNSDPLDMNIKLKFSAVLGEQFTVKLTLGDKVFSEHFIV